VTVVDSEAIKKVEKGVYRGFSIGGRVKERDPNKRSVITKITLTEISLVDRPSNPDAVLSIFKADSVDAKHRATKKPTVSRESVDTLMAAMTPESRAAVVTQAIQHLRVQPNLPWMKW
jgi:phage head maturation protease